MFTFFFNLLLRILGLSVLRGPFALTTNVFITKSTKSISFSIRFCENVVNFQELNLRSYSYYSLVECTGGIFEPPRRPTVVPKIAEALNLNEAIQVPISMNPMG